MFDIGWSELFVILVVTLVVVGPKDLPKVMRWAGYWTNRARMMAGQFQRVLDDMAREAELDKINKDLREATRVDVPPAPRPAPAAAPVEPVEATEIPPPGPGNTIEPPHAAEPAEPVQPEPEQLELMPAPVVAEIEAERAPTPEQGPPAPFRAPEP